MVHNLPENFNISDFDVFTPVALFVPEISPSPFFVTERTDGRTRRNCVFLEVDLDKYTLSVCLRNLVKNIS